MYISPWTLFIPATYSSFAAAATSGKNQDGSCSQANNKLQVGTYQLNSDCDATHYCDSSGKCLPKGCRRDEFPLGYAEGQQLPPRCRESQFCPDEEDKCQGLLAVGQACQLNRDDQCAPPPNAHELSVKGVNHNGSVCINFQCMWANVTQGQACVVEQMPYIAYGANDKEFIYVVSRGNCRPGLYCDASKKLCMQTKNFGESCTADKECTSDNCLSSLKCGVPPQAPVHFGAWVYVVVVLGIIVGMATTLISLYFMHRRSREQEREKRVHYWREQNAFRQNILQMRDTAKASLLSLALHGSDATGREHTGTEDSSVPILRRTGGFRSNFSDEDGVSSIHGETPITMAADQEMGGWGGRPVGRKLSKSRR